MLDKEALQDVTDLGVEAIPPGVTSCKLSDRLCIHLFIHKPIQKAIQYDVYSL